MHELSLHILDVTENGISAGADRIQIIVKEIRNENRLVIIIKDNGRGVTEDAVDFLTDPFFTSRTTRKVGMGLPLFKAAAQQCGGDLTIQSEPGKYTEITASFQFDHIDRAPVGDMGSTIMTLIAGNPSIDFIYEHWINSEKFEMNTMELRKALSNDALTDPSVLYSLMEMIQKKLNDIEP